MSNELIAAVVQAGIVGAGGAGFPTHVKLNAKADTVIINGAECEPLLRVDQQLMALRTEQMLQALDWIVEHVGAQRGVVALKSHYHNAVDALKAVAACLIGGFLLKPYGMRLEGTAFGGLAVMLGHVFPAFLGFRGGKGILSGFFVALMLDWRVAVLILAVFAVAYFATGYVSLGSVLASAAFGIGFALFYFDNLIVLLCGLAMSLLAIFMHRQNIARLLKGEERKTDLFKK